MMLQLITQYLILYKKVFIPNVGTIVLEPQSAALNFADRLMNPPTYTAALKKENTLSEHQLSFLALGLREEKESVQQQLFEFGKRIGRQMNSGSLSWAGIGNISITPKPLTEDLLQPVPAEKVVRENEDHDVLVGDKSLSSHQIKAAPAARKKSWFNVVSIGWIILALAIAAIAYYILTNQLSPVASGLRMKP